MIESKGSIPPAIKLAQRKFLFLGIMLAILIGIGLAVLNHYVRIENQFHEADMEQSPPAQPLKPIISPPAGRRQ